MPQSPCCGIFGTSASTETLANQSTLQGSAEMTKGQRLPEIGDSQDSLQNFTAKLSSDVLQRLVCHRGFHAHAPENLLKRPLENTLEALRQAWSAGVVLCEVDIHATKDSELVIHHDKTLLRLAMDEKHPVVSRRISDLTAREVDETSLKDGKPTPKLRDALKLCNSFPHAKIVLELKIGHRGLAAAELLRDMFQDDPSLMDQVAVVMSFDLAVMRYASKLLRALFLSNFSPHEPKLFLLTMTKENTDRGFEYVRLDVGNATEEEVDTLLVGKLHDEAVLDGLYVQFQESVIQDENCKAHFKSLANKTKIGVWMSGKDADYMVIDQELLDLGAVFVNTDFPSHFGQPLPPTSRLS